MNPLIPLPGVLPATLAAAALSLVFWMGFCFQPPSWQKSAIKTGTVLFLAFAAGLAGGPGALIVALLLCALGDYLLSRPSETQFMAGVGAFAAGHLAYVWLFLGHDAANPRALAGMPHLGFIALLALFGLFMGALLWRRAGQMRGPVVIYVPIILSMGVAVLALPSLWPLGLARPAAFMFILSDFILAMELFVLPAGHRLRRYTPFLVWPSYWGAQALFFLAFAGLPVA